MKKHYVTLEELEHLNNVECVELGEQEKDFNMYDEKQYQQEEE